MSSCGNDNNAAPENTGTDQVQPPVENSGPETEAERANEAVKQDTTNQEIHVGKDETGAAAKSTDTMKKH
ncbi:MAG TPA: hypothetical protein VLC28_00430 [Flavitalea sp.]|nr:hypothetical protein [Flavitalea sp.]